MPTYPFLSEEWIAEARRIREDFRDRENANPPSLRLNQVITEVPFGEGVLNAHLDTSEGILEIETGHLENPDVTITLDYETAKAIFVDGNPQAGMQAFMAGKIRVQGDMSKLMQMQAAPPDPVTVEVQQRIREITEGSEPLPEPAPVTPPVVAGVPPLAGVPMDPGESQAGGPGETPAAEPDAPPPPPTPPQTA